MDKENVCNSTKMKTASFTQIMNVEDIPKAEYQVTAFDFKGECVILTFNHANLNIFKWCDSLESAKEFYDKWKESNVSR